MPRPTRARFVRLAALAAVATPVVGCLLMLTPGRASAAVTTATITCPKSDGSPGGVTVAGTNHTCETVNGGATTLVVGGTVDDEGCGPACGRVTLTVEDPDGDQFTDGNAASGAYTLSVTVTQPRPGTYVATLSGDGADVRTSFDVAPTPSASSGATSGVGATNAPTSGAAGSSSPAPSSGGPSTAAAAPANKSGDGASTGAVVHFPALPVPAGIALLPPLPTFPASPKIEPGVPGPYGKTLPYPGSMTVAEKTASPPTLLRHVADTFDDKQVIESIAAAFLALMFAAHLRQLTRRPSGDAEL